MMPTDLKPSAQRVLAYMSEHGSITGQQAITDLGMTELRSRISEISRAGFPIKKEWQNSWGRVLDWIGVEWENLPDTDLPGQFHLDDYFDEEAGDDD